MNIFYVVDLARYVLEGNPDRNIKDPEIQKSYYYCAVGLIAQNVYLFAASQGLAAWFHNCDKTNTPKEFKLRSDQRVLFAQTVGYPALTFDRHERPFFCDFAALCEIYRNRMTCRAYCVTSSRAGDGRSDAKTLRCVFVNRKKSL